MLGTKGIDPVELSKISSSLKGQRQLRIGLVNNMPDAALRNTELQFQDLLSAAAPGLAALLLFYLPGVPRGPAGQAHINASYEPVTALYKDPVDALIVTGAVPVAADLTTEPYWREMTELIDWAKTHTISTIWSCLAAHAAVLHLDGVKRRPLGPKLSGLFVAQSVGEHSLIPGAPKKWIVPHSRYNELPESELLDCGYTLLYRSDEANADSFLKREKSLFVFLQGHPEYHAGTLLREYLRDISAFLAGSRDSYPDMPRHYFNAEAAAGFEDLRKRALGDRRRELLSEFPVAAIEAGLSQPWREPAARLYAGWLSYVAENMRVTVQP